MAQREMTEGEIIGQLAGDLRTNLARNVLGINKFEISDTDKKEVKRILMSRDSSKIPDIVTIFNSEKYAAVRNGKVITLEDVKESLKKSKLMWGDNGATVEAEKPQPPIVRIADITQDKSVPPSPPEMSKMADVEVPAGDMAAFNEAFARMTATAQPEEVALDLENMKLEGLEELAKLGAQFQESTPMAEIVVTPPPIVSSEPLRQVEAGPQVIVEQQAPQAVVEQWVAPRAVETVQEEVVEEEPQVDMGQALDVIKAYMPVPEKSLGRKLFDWATSPIRGKQPERPVEFSPDGEAGAEFQEAYEKFLTGDLEMVFAWSISSVDENGGNILTKTNEHSVITGNMPFWSEITAQNPEIDPAKADVIYQGMQKDGRLTYAMPLPGDIEDIKHRHFLVFRFFPPSNLRDEERELFRENPLEYTVQAEAQNSLFVLMADAHRGVVAALESGDEKAIKKAQDALKVAEHAVFELDENVRRAVATKNLLDRVGKTQSIFDKLKRERGQIASMMPKDDPNSTTSTVQIPDTLYNLLGSYNIAPRKSSIPAGKVAETGKTWVAFNSLRTAVDKYQTVSLVDLQREVNVFAELFFRYVPATEEMVHPTYVNQVLALREFAENPSYAQFESANEIVDQWSGNIREQFAEYYEELGRDLRIKRYREKLKVGITKDDEAFDEALMNLEIGLFELFRNDVYPNLNLQLILKDDKNRPKTEAQVIEKKRKAAFDAFTDWMASEAMVEATAGAGAELLAPILGELSAIAADNFQQYQEAESYRFKGEYAKYRDFRKLMDALEKQGLIPDTTVEQAVLFTNPELDDVSIEERNELISQHLLRRLTDSQQSATTLLEAVKRLLDENHGGNQELLAFSQVLARSTNKDRGRRIDPAGENRLALLLDAHGRRQETMNLLPMKGEKKDQNQTWKTVGEGFKQIYPDIFTVADLRDGSRENKVELPTVAAVVSILNEEVDKAKTEVETQVEAALK